MLHLRRTALYNTHLDLGARMVPFGGWEMPVSYSGITGEHAAVRGAVGLFDVSHMGEFVVTGSDALALVQTVTTNDAGRLTDGQAQYSTMANEDGGIVDDLLVYRFDVNHYMLVVNASNIISDLNWIQTHNQTSARIDDRSEDTGLLAIQGPRAVDLVWELASEHIEGLESFRFTRAILGGVAGTLSRTGYTGEDGYEFYFHRKESVAIWTAILERGEPFGILPVGLGARNTLRLEARLLLYGNDIDTGTNPYEAGIGWVVAPNKGPFIGRKALLGATVPERRLVGFEMNSRQIARDGYPVLVDGIQVGRVTSGGPSVTMKTNIGLAYVPAAHARVGSRFQVSIRDRAADAHVVPTPFYKRRAANEPR